MKVEMMAELREQTGKGIARRLRRRGRIPAVLYGQGECVLLSLDPDAVTKTLRAAAGRTALISLHIDGTNAGTRTALLRDYQVDPVTGRLLHADLFEISMTKPIRIKVPVSLTGGTPAGLKAGGVLHHSLREVHIECLPSAIPDHLEVGIAELQIGQAVHIKDLRADEGLRFLDDPDLTIVSVAAPISEAKLEALLTSGAGAGEGKEPEVIAKGKVEGAEGAGMSVGDKAEKKEVGKPEKKDEKKK